MATNLAYMTFRSRALARSRDKKTPLYLQSQIPYGYQTWQDGNLPRQACAYKVTSSFDHVVL